jgi:hypothetical protein
VAIENGQAVFRQGEDGKGRIKRKPWDAVIGWVLHHDPLYPLNSETGEHEPQISYQEFVESARLTHYDNLTNDEKNNAVGYEGREVVVFPHGGILCKEGDEYWYQDYKGENRGDWATISQKYYEFCLRESGLPIGGS